MKNSNSFTKEINDALDDLMKKHESKFPKNDVLKMDLHVHDHGSDVPDELMGRILGVPETWLPSEKLISILDKAGCSAYTITNHNNARSCYELQDKGLDVLVGAEFSVAVPEFNTGIHVLAYGFTPRQEELLNENRKNVYDFQRFALENDIPTIWAHPLYHYKSKGIPDFDFFDKMALVFERFEVINGQRDSWQNMLVYKWIESLNNNKIDELSKRFNISSTEFCKNPYKKIMTAGSDAHMGIFAGITGSYLYSEDLKNKLKYMSKSAVALEAIKKGNIAVYGAHQDSEKMVVSFIDYLCQIGIYMKDPGLMRIMLHKGDIKDKIIAMLAINGFFELRRHKLTTSFLQVFHNCILGEAPGFAKRLLVPKHYKKVFKLAIKMADNQKDSPEKAPEVFKESIQSIFNHLNQLLIDRLSAKVQNLSSDSSMKDIDFNRVIESIEVPSNLRALFKGEKLAGSKRMASVNMDSLLEGLSFPFLASSVVLAASFVSAKVLYNARPLLTEFSKRLGAFNHPKRMLWLTDTFEDKNGVAMVLQSILGEIRKRNLPIDMLVCSSTLKSADNLIVVKPMSEFVLPFYQNQPIRIPNIMEIHKIFKDGEYDRVICSTEGFMGVISLFLKNAYRVPAYFYIHTDWMMFAKKVLNFDNHNRSRLRRLLRAYYGQFDHLFVLNSDELKWFTGSSMNFSEDVVSLTAHWTEEIFKPKKSSKKDIFGVGDDTKILLFTGRLSEEKGVSELPYIIKKIQKELPDVKLAFAGTGPAESHLKAELPDAIFLGWVNHDKLPDIYSAADMLVLPSKFDTFGCVVLEALSCGLPVSAYETKGPKDIIEDGKCGFLSNSRKDMAKKIIGYFNNEKLRPEFKKAALVRAADYNSDKIISKLLKDIDFDVMQ